MASTTILSKFATDAELAKVSGNLQQQINSISGGGGGGGSGTADLTHVVMTTGDQEVSGLKSFADGLTAFTDSLPSINTINRRLYREFEFEGEPTSLQAINWNIGHLYSNYGGNGEGGEIWTDTDELSIDWVNRILYGNDSAISANFGERVLINAGLPALNWREKRAYDDSANLSINWQERTLSDASQNSSIDWNLGRLYKYGNRSINWFDRQFFDEADAKALDYDERKLWDDEGNASVAWNTYSLKNGEIDSLDWGDRLLYNNEGLPTLDWAEKMLSGLWTSQSGIQGATTITAGANISIGGNGTKASPYVITSTASGGGGSGSADLSHVVMTTGDQSITGEKGFFGGLAAFVNGVPSINTSMRKFFDAEGEETLDWATATLSSRFSGYTEESEEALGELAPSLDWHLRTLTNSLGDSVFNWEFGNILYQGIYSLDWKTRELFSDNGETVISWNDRKLQGASNTALNWGSRELLNAGGDTTVRWDGRYLQGFYVAEDAVTMVPVETLDWGNRFLLIGEAYGFASVAWEGFSLMGTGINSADKVGNFITANWQEGVLYSSRDSGADEESEDPAFFVDKSIDWKNRALIGWGFVDGAEEAGEFLSLDWNNRNLFGAWQIFNGGFYANTQVGEVETYLGFLDLGSGVADGEGNTFGPAWRNAQDLELIRFNSGQLFSIVDIGGEESPEYVSDLALDWMNRMFVGEWGFANGAIAAYSDPDEETGERTVLGYLGMPGLNGMGFYAPDGKEYLTATQRRLVGLNGGGFSETSLNWGTRNTFDIDGWETINWNNGTLSALGVDDEDEQTEIITLDWRNGLLLASGFNDALPAPVLSWHDAILYDLANSEEGQHGVPSLNWDERSLVNQNGQTTISWGSSEMFSQDGNFSIRWEDRWMYDADASITIDWNAGILFNPFGGPSVNFKVGQTYSDQDAFASIDWFTRDLRNSGDVPSLNWNSNELSGRWTSELGILGATRITAGANVTVGGDGTLASPYVIAASAGGSSGPGWSGFAGTTPVLSFATSGLYVTGTLAGNTTFTANGYAQGREMTLFINGDSITDTLAFPSWTWLEGAPSDLAASKLMRIDLICRDSTAAGVVATYGVQL